MINFFFQAEDGIRDLRMSRGLGDVYKRQELSKMNEIAQNTVLISGGAGSMGLLVSEYINSRDDFTLTAIHDPNYKGQEYKSYKDLTNIEEDVVLEFSPATVINENIDSLLNSDADLIIGSSGVSSETLSKLKTITDRTVSYTHLTLPTNSRV